MMSPTQGGKENQNSKNFKVVVRVRPGIANEIKPNVPFLPVVNVTSDNKACVVSEYLGSEIHD